MNPVHNNVHMFLWLILIGDDHGLVVAESHHFEGLVSGRAWGCNGGGYQPLAETVFVYINASRYPPIREACDFRITRCPVSFYPATPHETENRGHLGQRSSSLRGVPCVMQSDFFQPDQEERD